MIVTQYRVSSMKYIPVCLFVVLTLVGVRGDMEQYVRDLSESSSVVLFTKPGCPYCDQARKVLGRLPCRTLEVTLDTPEIQTALWNVTHSSTVPQIFIGGKFFGGYADLVVALANGQLFSQREPYTTPAPTSESPIPAERHIGLYKLIRSSEDAIRWISNKTTSSLNELFHVRNGNSSASSTEQPSPPQQTEKYQFLKWLKSAVRDPLAEDDSEESTTSGDSGGSEESVVFAHRTPDHGFAWGPPGKNESVGVTKDNTTLIDKIRYVLNVLYLDIRALTVFILIFAYITGPPGKNESVGVTKDNTTLIDKVRYVLNVLYLDIRTLTERCKSLIQAGLTKVFAKKDPFLMRQYASDSIEKQLEDMERNNGTQGHDVMFACDDTMKPVCGVDTDGHYTIFQNECKMVLLNYRYGTNFSVHDKDVCMRLFASSPDLFYQTPTTQQPIL
ncbi:hypothetical protein J6590_061005 [Homalodisca vitripennis]|nr:hypothetical protein J6590_061005 [Homalodisca vitripennis]